MEIASGVHRITLGGGEVGGAPSTHIYYVQGRDRGAFIDAGFPEKERTQPLLDYWRDTLGGPPTGWVLLSHRHHEHAGGAKLLKDATGALVAAGRGDVQAIDAEFGEGAALVDQPLDGDETFDLGDRRIRAIAAPGHTAGTACFLLEPEGLLFTGDHVMGQGTVVVRTDQGGDMTQHIHSLLKLKELGATVIHSGHGPPVTDVPAKIDELVRRRQEREDQVLGLLREGFDTVDALLARIYSDTPERLLGLARYQVIAHLGKLVAEGRIVNADDGATYRLS